MFVVVCQICCLFTPEIHRVLKQLIHRRLNCDINCRVRSKVYVVVIAKFFVVIQCTDKLLYRS